MIQSPELWVWPPAGQPFINPQDVVMKCKKVMESCFKYQCSTCFTSGAFCLCLALFQLRMCSHLIHLCQHVLKTGRSCRCCKRQARVPRGSACRMSETCSLALVQEPPPPPPLVTKGSRPQLSNHTRVRQSLLPTNSARFV